ncbi:MAG: hypothetical protein DHS20C16_31320 [Phycisphaerae bacterium]|nr:MAG: hypothetical protein DHS20C16_31320 [Phycisphaerae bacterium]
MQNVGNDLTKPTANNVSTAKSKVVRRTRFTKDTVIKYADPEAVASEVRKTKAAWEISQKAKIFRVARVLSSEPGADCFEQERLYGYDQLHFRAAFGSGDDPIWGRIGRTLGTIHRESGLVNDQSISLPAKWQLEQGPRVHLHGDFNLTNVRYNVAEDTVLIIDWAVTDMIGGEGDVGPIYFDLGWFLKSLFLLSRRLPIRRRLEEKADRFLAGYVCESGYSLNDGHLATFAIACGNLVVDGQAGGLFKRALDRIFLRRLLRYTNNGFKYRNYIS